MKSEIISVFLFYVLLSKVFNYDGTVKKRVLHFDSGSVIVQQHEACLLIWLYMYRRCIEINIGWCDLEEFIELWSC